MHRANFIGLARSKCLCGGGVTTWGQAWGPRDRNVTKLAKTSTRDLYQNWDSEFCRFRPQNDQYIDSTCWYSHSIDAGTYLDVMMCSWFMR